MASEGSGELIVPKETASLRPSRVGTQLRGKWTIDAVIGTGGMATVYSATHRNGKRVAIKMLHPSLASDRDASERFLREGYVANTVGHPGAVAVLDDDQTEDGAVFLVMELLEGQSLSSRIEQAGVLDAAEVLFIADQVLDVLAAAHDKGITHRDIKPGNVFLLHDGTVKVLDFGLARLKGGPPAGTVTREGWVLGTVSYMSPEQAQAKRDLVDRQSDLWSLGATLFTALSNRTVHEADTPMDRLLLAMRDPARSVAAVRPDLSPAVMALVDRALAYQKAERWSDARAMQAAVRVAYRQSTGQPIPSTRRTEYLGAAGWLRPARPVGSAGATPAESTLEVSVVFEPDGGASGTAVAESSTEPNLPAVTDSMIEETRASRSGKLKP